MTYSLTVLFAASLLIPIAASAQMDGGDPRAASLPILAMTSASRAGISAEAIANDRGQANPDTAVKHVSAGTRVRHAAVGGLAGIVAGGVIGAAIGAYQDRHSQSNGDEIMIPGAAIIGVLGAGVGLLLGVIIGADWP